MMRDPLQLLTEARPAHLEPGAPIPHGTRETELATAMAAPREQAAHRRRAIRPAWGWGLGLAGAAAATAVAVSVSGTTPPAPDLALPATPAQTQEVRLSASQVLLAAATQADRRPDAIGRYWHTASKSLNFFRVAADRTPYTVVSTQTDEGWTPYAPSGQISARSQFLGAKPATPTDEAEWKRAGSPSTFILQKPGAKGPKVGKQMPSAAGEVRTSRARPVFGDKIFWLGRNVSMKDLRALPGDPVKLKAQLLTMYAGHGTESSSGKMSADSWLFAVTTGLILDMPVSPKVRAAAFRMLAKLKSVKTIGAVKDADGRSGTAVAVTETTEYGGTQRHLLIIDREAGTALGDQYVVVKPGGITAGLTVGATISSRTVRTAEWTNTAPN